MLLLGNIMPESGVICPRRDEIRVDQDVEDFRSGSSHSESILSPLKGTLPLVLLLRMGCVLPSIMHRLPLS